MRLDIIKQKMGGSDHKSDAKIAEALALLPPLVLLEMTDEQIAAFACSAGEALHEKWRSGCSSGETSGRCAS